MIAPVALAALALVGAVLAPRALRRATWPDRSPKLGILLWLAVSLSTLGAVVLAGAALALPSVPFTTDIAELMSAYGAAVRAQYSTPAGAVATTAGMLVVGAVLARLGYCAAGYAAVDRRERWRQLDSLTPVARRDERRGVLIVEHSVAATYCLRVGVDRTSC